MENYWGIVIEQSLKSRAVIDREQILATKRGGRWRFLLVSVPGAEIAGHAKKLQEGMVEDDNWYAHYFRDNQMTVVFRDRVFEVTTEPDTWEPVIEHGLACGIPIEQLDFNPRAVSEAQAFFGI